jgi:hypothetical protein
MLASTNSRSYLPGDENLSAWYWANRAFFENTRRTYTAVSDPPRPDSDKAFASLVNKAVELAKSKTALGLPGYLAPEGWRVKKGRRLRRPRRLRMRERSMQQS